MNPAVHPLLGTGPEWEVTNFPTTVELRHRVTRQTCGFPKPYNPQPPEWWRAQAAECIAWFERANPKGEQNGHRCH